MKLTIREICKLFDKSISPELIENLDIPVNNFQIDSRIIQKNDVFVAFKGEQVNGHDYIEDAFKNGACLAIATQSKQNYPIIKVSDSTKALGLIASTYLKKLSPISIGITGTNGKSTVTSLTYSILNKYNITQKTYKNFNNQIGLPLSILSSHPSAKFFVLEMGASKSGDIRELSSIVRPNIVALLNVSAAHLESFGSIDNIFQTKEEILEDLGYEKTVILNKDDRNFSKWEKKSQRHKVITISKKMYADYQMIGQDPDNILIKTPRHGNIKIPTKYREDYMLTNILFAIACASEAGVDKNAIKFGIKDCKLPAGRFSINEGINGSSIIDSTYNANPNSFKAAIDSISLMDGQNWLIMGEMGELSINSKNYHIEVVKYAISKNIKKIFIIGKDADEIKSSVNTDIYVFESKEDLTEYIKPMLNSEINVLIKASRFMKFESIVESLTNV